MIDLEKVTAEKLQKVIDENLLITDNNYEEKLLKLPAIYAAFSIIFSKGEKELSLLKATLDQLIAGEKVNIRENGKKSVDEVNSLVDNNKIIFETKVKIIQLEEKVLMLKSLLKSFDIQRDCLIQISANKREEKKSFGVN